MNDFFISYLAALRPTLGHLDRPVDSLTRPMLISVCCCCFDPEFTMSIVVKSGT